MSIKSNTNKGGKKAKNYGSKGGGMHRHATSGYNHNHANTIARVREHNKELERIAEMEKRKKGKLYSSVKEVFQNEL